MRGPNHGIDLGHIDARMPEQGPNLFQVMLLLQHFHRDPMTQIMGFQHQVPNEPPMGFAEPPDVFALHWRSTLSEGPPSPQRPEQRRLRHDLTHGASQPFDVGMEIRHHTFWQRNVPRLSPFDSYPPKAPSTVEVSYLKRSDRLAPHPCVPYDQKNGDITRPLALLGYWFSSEIAPPFYQTGVGRLRAIGSHRPAR